MKYKVNGIECEVIITRKSNKNTYIRIKDDFNIYVTTNYLVTKNKIKDLLDKNYDFLVNNLKRQMELNEKKSNFYIWGNKYDIIFYNNETIEIIGNRIYTKDYKYLDKWLKKQINSVFLERLNYNYNLYEENIPYPSLRIRKMKTRWGVCNKKTNTVTLNSELIKYNIDKLDYVIIHELSHFIYFDHSKNFWKQVEKYTPNYKAIRKELKE